MSCGVGHRPGSDSALLWLRQRLAAVAPIHPLAWELPYATGAALEKKKKRKKEKKESYVITSAIFYWPHRSTLEQCERELPKSLNTRN